MLRIEGLSAGYGESRVLREVSLDVPRGRTVCLMGRNGVGKTTLLKSVMGLLPAWSGRVLLDGEEVTTWSPDERARRGVGYVPQGREIFASLTVEENLLVGLEAMASRRAAIPDEVFDLFPALRSMRRRRGGDLSGGQQQQLAFARALVGRPKVLLLDEPTEGIQPSIIIQIEEVIERLKARGDLSILLVEQYVEFAARLADDFAIMERGAIVARGATRDLNEDVVRRYLVV
ncbi:MAG: urea ABC transporter ATP-binding subunit UrtE [Nitrospirae bacterium RIFCSPHIGHO2_01_FULL_66_17]|nr:MAG: urea ABC transporter ATP-binding subunit UrtE [Nitrospirae bacterium RIFCSPHIGHO2_01_FULL_66_17]